MKTILLIISFLRSSPKTIDEALNLARQHQASLIALFVIDAEYAESIAHKLADQGWVGSKPSDHLRSALLREYRLQANRKLEEIRQRAEKMDVRVKTVIKSGSVLEETLKLAESEQPGLIVITRRKRSNLSRFIFGSVVSALRKAARCKVQVIDEES